MSDVSPELLVSLGDVAAEPIEQTGPASDFIYVDISSIDRETKRIVNAKTIIASEAPSRAKQVLRTGDVVISMTRPNLNAVALVPNHLDGAIGSTGFHVLRSRWIKPEFLFGLVQTDGFIDSMCDVVQGALYPAVRPKDIAAFKFVLQSPNQQTRIVEKLEELLSDLDAGVAELKAAQVKLGQYRQSLLKAAVEGALTAQWRAKRRETSDPSFPGRRESIPAADSKALDSRLRGNDEHETGAQLLARILTERRARWEAKQLAKFESQGKAPPKDWQKKYPEPVQPDISDLPELPEGWVWASVDALIADGPQNGIYLPASLYGSGTSILRIDDYQIGWHRPRSDLNLVNADHSAIATYSLCLGDLVVNRVNSMTHLGKSLCIGDELVGAIFESNMMRLHLSENVSEEYVALYLGSHIGRSRLIKDAKWAVNQASINQEDVKRTPIPFPPIEEQVRLRTLLIEQLSGIDAQLRDIDISLKQSTAQRKNILKAAFSGQLVPQDPNDEPASVLLERIRAERAERDAVKKPRGRKTRATA